jgi:hypothetical protein
MAVQCTCHIKTYRTNLPRENLGQKRMHMTRMEACPLVAATPLLSNRMLAINAGFNLVAFLGKTVCPLPCFPSPSRVWRRPDSIFFPPFVCVSYEAPCSLSIHASRSIRVEPCCRAVRAQVLQQSNFSQQQQQQQNHNTTGYNIYIAAHVMLLVCVCVLLLLRL